MGFLTSEDHIEWTVYNIISTRMCSQTALSSSQDWIKAKHYSEVKWAPNSPNSTKEQEDLSAYSPKKSNRKIWV